MARFGEAGMASWGKEWSVLFRLGTAGMALFGEVWCGVPRYGVAGEAGYVGVR